MPVSELRSDLRHYRALSEHALKVMGVLEKVINRLHLPEKASKEQM